MNPFRVYLFDFDTQIAIKTIRTIMDWATGNTPMTVTSDAKDHVDIIAQNHHVPVTIATRTIIDGDTHTTHYVCEPLAEEKQALMLTQLKRELNKMPAAALQKINIRHLTLCGSQRRESALESQTLKGLTNWQDHTMYLSAAHVFHHELFHMMWGNPSACGGNNVLNNCHDSDEEWSSLETKPWYQFRDIDPNEERPEYARYLFSLDTPNGRDHYDKLIQEAGTRTKIEKVKAWLKRVDPRLNDQFWVDLRQGKVGPDYWMTRK
jgi:hypothetical protein